MKILLHIHRGAMLAYPPSFRRAFGADVQEAFEARLAAARPAARRAFLFFFLIADAVASGLLERGRLAAMRSAWPREYAALVASSRRSLFMTRESLFADLKLALRQFKRSPVFAALTVLTLALGIGANTAIFGVVYAVLLRPLPYADPGGLVMIWSDNTRNHEPNNPVSPANYAAIKREATTSLSDVTYLYSFLTPVQFQSQPNTDPELIQAITIAPDVLRVLGRTPLLGRVFNDTEPEPAAVLSYAFWKRTFGGDTTVIGRTVLTPPSNAPVRIVGVMPEDFVFPYRSMLGPSGFTRALSADVWLPHNPKTDTRFQDASGQPVRIPHYLGVIARLKAGKTITDARAELGALAARRAQELPESNRGWGLTVKTLHEQTVGKVRPALLVLLLGVAVVMLITCVNVANVLLARATGQQRDRAIRSALGASRRRLVQQSLVESTALAIAGGALGIVMMGLGTRLLIGLAPPDLPRLSEATPGLAAALFAFAISLLTGLVIGSIPAWSASRSRASESMRDGSRTTTSASSQRVRSALIVAEVMMAMALTLGAALLLRSFMAVMSVNPGFSAAHLLTFQMNVPSRLGPAPPDARLAYYDDLEARLRAIPGVVNVGGTTRMPLGSTNVTTTIAVEGRSNLPAEMPEIEMRRSIFDFVGTMEIPVLRGRAFTKEDGPGAPPPVLINEALATRVFPGEDPIGKHVALGGAPAAGQSWLTVVGIIGSVRHGSLEEAPKPEIYLQYRYNTPVAPFIAIRTTGDPAAVGAQVREAVKATGANPPFNMQTMEALRSESVSERRFVLALIVTFGALALALAAVGVYGVITLIVAERRAEVGIRLALGATPVDVGRLMVRQAVVLATLGVALGCAVGLALSPWFGSVLYGVKAIDPLTYVVVAAILVMVAAGAALVPARRAMKVDPAVALRG